MDTRALTRKLRNVGVMMGAISTDETPAEALQRIADNPYYGDIDFVRAGQHPRALRVPPEGRAATSSDGRLKIVVVDYGIRVSILRNLYEQGCRPSCCPAR